MPRTAWIAGRVCLIGLALGLAPALAGCSSDRAYRSQTDTTNVVRRPVYDSDGSKNYYLGGYAGANYDYGARPAQ